MGRLGGVEKFGVAPPFGRPTESDKKRFPNPKLIQIKIETNYPVPPRQRSQPITVENTPQRFKPAETPAPERAEIFQPQKMTEQLHQKHIFNQNPTGKIFNRLYPGLTGIDPNSIAAQVKVLQASQERK